jgi:polysaccharide pyruvyl transferase WcaK-like protein
LIVHGALPDLALGLHCSSAKAPRGSAGELRLGLSFRTDQYHEQEAQVHELVRAAACILSRTSLVAVLVAQVAWDVKPMQKLALLIEQELGIPTELVIAFDDIEACQAAYETCDIVLSNRLHALLIAASRCSSILACLEGRHNRKIVGLFKSLGWVRHMLDVDAFNTESLEADLSYVLAHGVDPSPAARCLREGFAQIVQGGKSDYSRSR